jgi:phosphate-selective porin OprO/OprP
MNQFKIRATVAAVAGVALFGLASAAKADSADDLLKKLRDKGVLTEQEYDEFNTTRDSEKVKKNSEIKASFKDGIVWESGDKQHSMKVGGRVHFDYHNIDAGGTRSSSITAGKSTLDVTNSNDPDSQALADNFEIRRARIDVQGKFYNDYTYQIETNLVGSSPNLINQAWVNLGWYDAAQLRFGRYKEPFNLEKMTSSNNIDFNERSWVNSVAPNEVLGAMVWGEPTKGLIYQVNAFQKDFSESDSATNDMFYGGRVAANIAQFAGWSDTVVHVGVAGYDGEWAVKPASTSQNKLDAATRGTVFALNTEGRGLKNIFRAQIGGNNGNNGTTTSNAQSQGASSDASVDQRAYGLELAAAKGPVKFQTEYTKAHFNAKYDCSTTDTTCSPVGTAASASTNANRISSLSGDVKIWYAEALWLITGESYADTYKQGAWGAIKPKNDFVHPSAAASTGGWGAWELGLRYSNFDASDLADGLKKSDGTKPADNVDGTLGNAESSRVQGFTGAHAWTGGIKWIINPNLRFLADYTYTKYEGTAQDQQRFPIDVQGTKCTATLNSSNSDCGALADSERAFTIRGQINF